MKSELIHLLAKLRIDYPDAKGLMIPIDGEAVLVVRQHNTARFESFDALEAYAWPEQNNPS